MSLLRSIRNSVMPLRIFTSSSYVTRQSTSDASHEKPQNNDMPVDIQNPFTKENPQCILCKLDIKPDYKNTKLLSQFVSPYTGRVYGRHVTRLCKKKQEEVRKELVKAQNAGLMPFCNKEPIFLEDPKLFNPEKPFRNHDYC